MDTAARHAQLKEALVDAALQIIATEGIGGLKARALADEVGCAVGAIYNVVADLDELILLTNSRTLSQLETALTSAAASGSGVDWAVEQLVKLALAYLEFATTYRPQWHALFDHRTGEKAVPDWYRLEQERMFSYVERPVDELRPGLAPAERLLLARSMFSAVHGLVALGLEEKLQFIPLPTLRQQVTTIAKALGRGLAQPA